MKIKKETKIGVFAVVSILLLYWGVNFVQGSDVLRRNNTYYASYEQVSGLKVASPVILKGLSIGVIQNMSYDPTKSENVIVEMSVKNKYKIPKNSKAKVFSDGLMGGKALEIMLGDSDEYYKDGDTLISSIDKDLMSLAGSELDAIKIIAKELVDEVMITLKSVNILLASNQESVTATMQNLSSISSSLNDVVGSEAEQLKQLIANLNAMSKALSDNTSKIDNILGNVEGLTDSLSKSEFPTMVANLSNTMGELNTVLSGVNSGKGTLGRLAGDEALYDSLAIATSNLAVLLEDLKANPSRYVHFSLFGKKNK
ncbi:MAG: MlaD family protein [Rikenellaceae bacterium]